MTALRLGALFGASGVALGAFGAHALAEHVTPARLATWDTATRYQLVHAVALLALADRFPATRRWWTAGIAIFSGSLYALVLTDIGAFGAITPLGGLSLIFGWLLLLRPPAIAGAGPA